MTIPIAITNHAMRRYIERVLRFDFTHCDLMRVGDDVAVIYACSKLGVPVSEIEATIRGEVEPRVPVAFRRGDRRRVVRGETARYFIEGGRHVVSTAPLEWGAQW